MSPKQRDFERLGQMRSNEKPIEMQPFLLFHDQLGGDGANIVVIDIHPLAASTGQLRRPP